MTVKINYVKSVHEGVQVYRDYPGEPVRVYWPIPFDPTPF
jgi:hypothetical protein